MRWLSLWLCVILTGLHALAQETLTNDPRLQTRITVWLKMEPLRDTLRAISKQIGVPLRCQDAIQHYKVSVFVEDRLAGEILTQLAALFRYAWRKDEEGYVLYVPDETRQQEEGVLRAAREARMRALRDVIRFAREALKNPPADTTEFSRAPSDGAPPEEWNRRLVYWHTPWRALQAHAPLPTDPNRLWLTDTPVLLAILAKMPPQAERALLNGQLVGFSTRPPSGVYPMPADIVASFNLRGFQSREEEVDGVKRIYSEPSSRNPDYWGVWIRLSEYSNLIEYEFMSMRSWERQADGEQLIRPQPELWRQEDNFRFHTAPYVSDHSWVAQWRAWATPQKEWEARIPERAFTERNDRPKPTLYDEAFYPQAFRRVNGADLLEWFAWHTRLPVIAESFRTDVIYMRNPEPRSPREALQSLASESWLRIDESGYVLRRVQWYWGRRAVELPEDWLRPLEQRFAQNRWLELEDYVALAGRLTERQVDYYTTTYGDRVDVYTMGVTVRFPFMTLTANLRGLRFLASLSAAQRRQLLSGEWMRADTLTLPQRQRFQEALEERFPPPERLMVIDFPYRTTDRARLRTLGAERVISFSGEAAPVERAAFRLQFAPEKPSHYMVLQPGGAYSLMSAEPFSGGVEVPPEIEAQLRRSWSQNLLQQIYNTPGAQVRRVHTQGYTLELQAPPARRKTYYIFQQRAEPVDVRMLEARLKELEKPNEDTQANRP